MSKLLIEHSCLLILATFILSCSGSQISDVNLHKLVRRQPTATAGGGRGGNQQPTYVVPDHPNCTAGPNTYFTQIDFNLQANNSVWDTNGKTQFNISNEHHIKHGFYILDTQGKVVFIGVDKKSAACHFDYTYHARNTSTPLSLQLKVLGMSTDRWFMKFNHPEKNGTLTRTRLKYHRDGETNTGPIKRKDDTVAVISRCKVDSIPWLKSASLTGYATQFEFKILDYPLEYFFGLYELVDKRMDRCGT